MKKTSLGLFSLVAAAAFAVPAHAQIPNITPFSLEVRGGLAVPTGDFGEKVGDDPSVETGYTVGANATYHFMPLLGVYAGYTYNRFGLDGFDGVDVVDQGLSAGVRVAVPTPLIPIDPYLKAGVVYNRVGFEFDEGDDGGELDDATESDQSLGFEVGAGIGIGLGPKLSFTPQVTYTRYEPQFDGEGIEVNVEHVRVDVGLRIRL
ncbi:outer membrane beta-barrel protein [Longimicrobium sp.]|uniref:outer membrane beta-barrel protein n=1 Tax=Longimicrobium sp. TaxID=2029185 RepID=UPI002E2F4B8A|nr:outer membrane beta-barrel protein [Longimicrobium sp.]HEX6041640.1 outer membrane beta-barrel protein [Longimicrobium sp.]